MKNTHSKIINFAAGPSTLPDSVKNKSSKAIIELQKYQQSVLEVNHRGYEFDEIHHAIREKFEKVQPLPKGYSLLLLPGGATFQFSAIPMNLCAGEKIATYADSGEWSSRASSEASKITNIDLIDKSIIIDNDLIKKYCHNKSLSYIHLTSNETVDGIEYPNDPQLPDHIPLIADMSSNILSRPIDIDKFSLIYASTQKNLGIASLCLVIIKDTLLEKSRNKTSAIPDVFNYHLQHQKNSTINTPSLFNWHVTDLMLDWIHNNGGLTYFENQRNVKSSLLYDYIDNSSLFKNNVDKQWRSKINIVCDLHRPELTDVLVKNAKEKGIINISGHKKRGGLRFSCYNAMPVSAVEYLIDFMFHFEKTFYLNNKYIQVDC